MRVTLCVDAAWRSPPTGPAKHIEEELGYSRAVFRVQANWPVIDVTSKAIEETAADILRIYKERLGVP